MPPRRVRLALAVALALGARSTARAQPLQPWADLVARGAAIEAPVSWIEGGTGRVTAGGAGRDGWEGAAIGEAQLGVQWNASDRFAAHLHLRAREQVGDRGRRAGLVEAWVQTELARRDGADRFRLRGGQMFLPTSRENVGPLWSSPYTLTLSAIDSWIGEEVRPLGVMAEYETDVQETTGWRAGGSLFWADDTMGALLAWRGWAMGDRLAVTRETLPLPRLPSLEPGGLFEHQREYGTTPLREIDGRPGWASWLRWRAGDTGLVQFTHLDNRGDRELYDDEYSWQTRFDLVGLEWHPAVAWTIAGEAMRGRTRMGVPRPAADADFRAAYVLASWEDHPLRWSVRVDGFATDDRDHQPLGERSDERGHAVATALRWRPVEAIDLGLELLEVHARRAALAGPGERQDGGRAVTLSLRWRIGTAG